MDIYRYFKYNKWYLKCDTTIKDDEGRYLIVDATNKAFIKKKHWFLDTDPFFRISCDEFKKGKVNNLVNIQ